MGTWLHRLALPVLMACTPLPPTWASACLQPTTPAPPSTTAMPHTSPPAAICPAVAPPAGDKRLRLSAQRHRLGMSKDAEFFAGAAGIGAALGLTAGLINGEREVESTLGGAALGLILPILLVAAGPHVAPVLPPQVTRALPDAASSSRLRASGTPLINLRISGRNARGRPGRSLQLGIDPGFRFSYVKAW
jgi:hypothetical protein